MSVLNRIVEKKKERLAAAKAGTPLSDLKSRVRGAEETRDFLKAIRRTEGGLRLIAEIKKASPSKGLIRPDMDHLAIARIYEEKKVDAISVLTEEDFFQGRLDFLPGVKQAVSMPVLRKDFILDEYQIYEARASGADAVLLIAAILERSRAVEFLGLAQELGLAVLFEVHDRTELETALSVEAPVIGINNRDLKTLTINLSTSIDLKREIPGDRTVVAESGIRTREDVLRLEAAGIDAMLVGTRLMEAEDIGGMIDLIRGR